jgi:hypothetical protein
MLEECTTIEQRSVVRFCGQKLGAEDNNKEMLPVYGGSVCRIKWFMTGWQTFC